MLMNVPAVRCRLNGLLLTQCSSGTELLISIIKITQRMRFFGLNAKSHLELFDMFTVKVDLSTSTTNTLKYLQLMICHSIRRCYSEYSSFDFEFYSSNDKTWNEKISVENFFNWLIAIIHAEDISSFYESSIILTTLAFFSFNKIHSNLIDF